MVRRARRVDTESIRQAVREGYGRVAREGGSCGCTSSCCSGSKDTTAADVAKAVGYADSELAGLPEGANMGLSCGNPTGTASLKKGEVVLDLGSGGGFDVFIAGRKVGVKGRAIGVDMTPDMISKARANVAAYRRSSKLNNAEFRLGEIEHLPVADASVDVVISNCVINLSPDKPQVWREIARVLKPGGRVAVSDLALYKPLPAKVRAMVEALVGCIAGAVLVEDTYRMAKEAWLVDVVLTPNSQYFESKVIANDPLYRKVAKNLPKGAKPGDYVTSLLVTARKP